MIDYFIDYEVKDGDFYHQCTLKIAFKSFHHGMLESFPVGHKFYSVSFDGEVISFYDNKRLISRHKIGVFIGQQIQA